MDPTRHERIEESRTAPVVSWSDEDFSLSSENFSNPKESSTATIESFSAKTRHSDNETLSLHNFHSNESRGSVIPTKCDFQTINKSIKSAKNDKNNERIDIDHDDVDGDEEDYFNVNQKNNNVSSESSEEQHYVIPDGGWGWVIVFASIVISMIADGISFSFGLLYVEYLEQFKESNSKTSWIGGLFLAVPLLTGPIMSALVDRYGCRKMTVLGGFISFTGFALSALSNSIEMMYLTFGVIGGLGLGLCYVTAVVSITFWFDKKRNLAVGLGACGTGIGTFVYAPLTQFFIAEYGWRGTNLLLAATYLYICVVGALMKDPDWLKKDKSLSKFSNATSMTYISKNDNISTTNYIDIEKIKSILKSSKPPELILKSLVTYFDQVSETKNQDEKCGLVKNHSLINLPTFLKEHEKVPTEVIQSIISNKKLYKVILDNYPSLISCRSISECTLNQPVSDSKKQPLIVNMSFEECDENEYEDEDGEKESMNKKTTINIEDVTKNCAKVLPTAVDRHKNFIQRRQVSTSSNCLRNIRVNRNSLMFKTVPVYTNTKYCLRASSCPSIYRNSMVSLRRFSSDEKWYSSVLDFMKGICDLTLFLDYHFLLFSISTILLFTWFIVPYFYLKEYMSVYGYEEDDASYVISLSGVASTIGMVFLGWLGDKPWVNVKKAFSWCLIGCGLSVILMKYAIYNYYLLIVASCFFGLFFASSFAYTPMILAGLVDFNKFTSAYGLVLLCQGIGNLIGPPLAGAISDYLGSFDVTFYHSGFWIVISGICIWITDFTENKVFFS